MCESGLQDNAFGTCLGESRGVLSMRLVSVQNRRVHAIQVEMQNRLLVNEEKLKQVKAVLMECQTLDSPHRSPRQCQMQYSSSEEVLCEKRPASLSLFCVCFS